MPSWIALITTALVSFHTRILILPLLLLAGLFPPLHSILQLLVIPFGWAGWGIKWIGVILQALLLVQSFVFDRAREKINTFISSKPTSQSTSHSLFLARPQLENLTTNVYPTKLESLWAHHFEPLVNNPENEYQLSESDLSEWETNGNTLKRDIEDGIKETVGLWIELIDSERSGGYLRAVGEELERIQSGRSTEYLYSSNYSGLDEEELGRRVEQFDNEAKAMREAELDRQFEEFLDTMKMPLEARATLDAPSDPKNPSSQSFRQVLREGWEGMYVAEKGGVLGNFNRELEALGEMDLGMGRPLEPEDKIEDRFNQEGYRPGRIPLMTNHYLRDQVQVARRRNQGVEWFVEEDPTDLQILPHLSRKTSDDYLNFFQRSVKVDLLSRQLATQIISYFLPSPTLSKESDEYVGPSILLGGPFPEFIRKLDWTLTRMSERWLSPHQFALAAFGGLDGYVAVERKRREVERLEGSLRDEEAKKAEKIEL